MSAGAVLVDDTRLSIYCHGWYLLSTVVITGEALLVLISQSLREF